MLHDPSTTGFLVNLIALMVGTIVLVLAAAGCCIGCLFRRKRSGEAQAK